MAQLDHGHSLREDSLTLRLPTPLLKALTLAQTIHYIYRALLCPLLNPSMAPMGISVWFFALCFQITNGTCIGGWLAGYGPRTWQDWEDGGWPLEGKFRVLANRSCHDGLGCFPTAEHVSR